MLLFYSSLNKFNSLENINKQWQQENQDILKSSEKGFQILKAKLMLVE